MINKDNNNIKINKGVHFYVARHKNNTLLLSLGKPNRGKDYWVLDKDASMFISFSDRFQAYGLDENDFNSLTWENEPIEVFVDIKSIEEFKPKSFVENVELTDEYTKYQWISVKDDLPYHHKELLNDNNSTVDVLVVRIDFDGEMSTTVCNMVNHTGLHETNWCWRNSKYHKIIYWMLIPTLSNIKKSVMIREEEIRKAAMERYNLSNIELLRQLYLYEDSKDKYRYESFIEGAEWADENQKSMWVNVKDKLPEIDIPVIIETVEDIHDISYVDCTYEWQGHIKDTNYQIARWMYIPK